MWIDKLERKIGRFAIPHLMRYIVLGQALVWVLSLLNSQLVNSMALIPAAVMQGQIWRLLTFIFIPSGGNIFMMGLTLYCYYWIGETLENACGTFRFNLYYFMGIIITIIMAFITKSLGLITYVNHFLFITLATLYPDAPILLMYVFPMKAKWAAAISAAFLIYDFIAVGPFGGFLRSMMLAAFINYLLFFLPSFLEKRRSKKRYAAYQKMSTPRPRPKAEKAHTAKTTQADTEAGKVITGVAFHKCHVCGITDVDDPNMTFRYCSRCNGNYEYCEEHLHNHQHVE